MISMSVALLMLAAAQVSATAPVQETRLVVSGKDSEAVRRLQDHLGVTSTSQTTIGQQIWTVPTEQASAVLRRLQASTAVEAADYAGDDFRTLFIDAPPSYLEPAEQAQLDAVRSLTGVEDVRIQRNRWQGLSRSLLRDGFGPGDGLPSDGAFLLDLPGRTRIVASGASAELEGRVEWRGSFTAAAAGPSRTDVGQASLAAARDAIEGSLLLGDDLYLFIPLGSRGLQAVAHFKTQSLPRDHADDGPGGAVPGEGAGFVDAVRADAVATPAETPVISVGIVWTSAAEAEARTYSNHIGDRARQLISEANNALDDSRATFRFRLSAARAISGAESGSFRADALALANRADGRWDDVHAWRDQTRSDVVVLIRSSVQDHCGEAVAINAGPDQAFAVASYFCAIAKHTVSHELGHLLGARHVNDSETTSTPAYARGHFNGTEWRTIMVEDQPCGGCGRINYWANPEVEFFGVPTGVANQNHDLRVINANAVRVAAYR